MFVAGLMLGAMRSIMTMTGKICVYVLSMTRTVCVPMTMACMAVSVMASKYGQIDQIDCNACDCENEHKLAIDLLRMNDAHDGFIYQDAGHHPDDED